MRTSFLAAIVTAAALSAPLAAPAATQPALTYTQPLAPPAVQAIQEHLHRLGAYGGRADGLWGPDSQAALERFQQSHGLQVTGQLNPATVATLGLSPTDVLGPQAAAVPLPGSPDASTIRAIQARLRELNFYRGPADGMWGAETQQALERFQQGRGLQPNGQINPATIAALGLDPARVVSR